MEKTRRASGGMRNVVFISKATPGDDEFVLWVAPRLEAAGYTVFADILSLEPGDRWRRQVTGTLQDKATKMLLCCRDSTLDKNGVQEEIGIAEDLVKELKDPRFIIPLRLEKFKKVFGIGELQFVDFVGGWAKGLRDLLDTLDRQRVPRATGKIEINPNWENYKKRLAIRIEHAPEALTANWLRISGVPETVRYYQPPGAINHALMESTCRDSHFPAEIHNRGFFSFATPEEMEPSLQMSERLWSIPNTSCQSFLRKAVNRPLYDLGRRGTWSRPCSGKPGKIIAAQKDFINTHSPGTSAFTSLKRSYRWAGKYRGDRRDSVGPRCSATALPERCGNTAYRLHRSFGRTLISSLRRVFSSRSLPAR